MIICIYCLIYKVYIVKKKILWVVFLLCIGISCRIGAHPHAFIDMKTKVLTNNEQLVGFSMQWVLDEASSAAVLYDLQLAKGDIQATKKLIDDVITNIVNEHYFSYLFDKSGNKIKYSRKPANYGMKSNGMQVLYHFDFFLATPKPLKENLFELSTYDPTYYVAMLYEEPLKSAVDFSNLPSNCRGEVLSPQIDEKIQAYAASLDKTQRDEDSSLGVVFAQKVRLICK